MTADTALELARQGALDTLRDRRASVAEAIRMLAERGDAPRALELFGRTWRIWLTTGDLEEGGRAAAAALSAAGNDAPTWRARALYGDGVLAFRSGDTERSRRRNEEALTVARSASDVRGECEALTGLARLALREGRYDDVVQLSSTGREIAHNAGDREAEASPLHLQAAGVRLKRDYAAARDLYLQSLALNTELGNDAWQAMELDCLGWVELHLGNIDEAEARFRERDGRLGSDPYARAWSRLTWAAVAVARGDGREGRRRFDDAANAIRELSNELDPDDQVELDWVSERLAALGV